MKNRIISIHYQKLILLAIIILALIFRLYGLDWDQGQHLHPDERFLTMVMDAMRLPKNLADYLNPQKSTMNPYNLGYGFFVYGTFPLNLTKIIGIVTNNDDYGKIHLVGRFLSAIFDVGIVILLFKIGKKIFNEKTGLLAAFLYSIMVLPIQLSHFFAVDTFLNFFLILSFYFLVLLISQYPSILISIFLGGSFGLALACKINAILFLPIIALGFLLKFLSELLHSKRKLSLFLLFIAHCLLITTCCYLAFRFNQPQAFINENFLNFHLNPQFIKNLQELESYNNPKNPSPPAIQWLSTKPIIFPLKNLILWGLGLPLGIICIISLFYSLTQLLNLFSKTKKEEKIYNLLISSWVIFLFTYQGIQFAKTIRYFLFIYPFLALLASQFVNETYVILKRKIHRLFTVYCLLFTVLMIYPFSFMNIYTKPITRVTASEWIYQNIPPGSTILNEEWDDGLPLSLEKNNASLYNWQAVFMYDPDSLEKWQRILPKLNTADYIIISSNRAYGAIMRLPAKYPQTTEYYQSLFDGTGKFTKVAEFTSYPCFPPGKFNLFCFNDDSSEESFTVYDHPKVMIFKRKS